MNKIDFEIWLERQGYNSGTINSRISNCIRVEEYEGDLDFHYQNDSLEGLLSKLRYSEDDKRKGNKQRHSIPINGDIRNGTATFKSAITLYRSYKDNCNSSSKTIGLKKTQFKLSSIEEKHIEIGSREDRNPIDSYELMFRRFNINKEDFYDFGIDSIIRPQIDKIYESWRDLKARLYNDKEVFIRAAGREGKGTDLYLLFYSKVFNNQNIIKDPTNNHKPQQIIQNLTGLKRNEDIFNYQVSHIFGRTKNPLMFESAWNIALIPKVIDPLTGHETKGIWPEEFQHKFHKRIRQEYDLFINDYNSLIRDCRINDHLEEFCNSISNNYSEKQISEFIKGIKTEFSML